MGRTASGVLGFTRLPSIGRVRWTPQARWVDALLVGMGDSESPRRQESTRAEAPMQTFLRSSRRATRTLGEAGLTAEPSPVIYIASV